MKRPHLLLVVQIACVTAILVCLVLVAGRHPWRLDLTPERSFTLSPHTHEVLARLDAPVDVTVFYSGQEGVIRREMTALLALYQDASPRLRVHMLDLDRSPGAAERLGVSNYNVAVVESGQGEHTRREQVSIVNEDGLTAALLKVAGVPTTVAYFVQGHGEHDPKDDDGRTGAAQAARALSLDGFDVRTIEGAARIPADANLVILAGPTRDLQPAEIDALAAWVHAGGNLLALVDPGSPASVGELLARFGVEQGRDIVVDEQARLFGTDGLAARVTYLNQKLIPATPEAQALLPLAQSLRLVDEPGVTGDYLALTSEATWADVDRRGPAGGEVTFRRDVDRTGPLPVGVFLRVPQAGSEAAGRVVVLGDSDFVTNLHLGVLGNRDLLVAVTELSARTDVLTAARRPAAAGGAFSGLALTAREARLVFWTAVLGPALLFTMGALLVARRRLYA